FLAIPFKSIITDVCDLPSLRASLVQIAAPVENEQAVRESLVRVANHQAFCSESPFKNLCFCDHICTIERLRNGLWIRLHVFGKYAVFAFSTDPARLAATQQELVQLVGRLRPLLTKDRGIKELEMD